MKKKSKLFRNLIVDKQQLKEILLWSFYKFGKLKACALLDHLKNLGFFYSTKAGVSLSIEDLRVPPIKSSFIRIANKKMKQIVDQTDCGKITQIERFQKIISLWNQTSEALKSRIVTFLKETDPLNPIYMMAFSGARGNISQVRQLIGIRGLMVNPSGDVIDLPITSNFREGLTIADFLISAYGARKGVVDTSLKTADSGYLTRRLIDVAQDIIIKEEDCGTNQGIKINLLNNSEEEEKINLVGRILTKPIINPITKNLIANKFDAITSNLEGQFKKLKILSIYIRSPLTCMSKRAICQKCYGWDFSSENLIHLGEAVGILAAQSIGEPGTQLTMRTFHTGGVFSGIEIKRQICSTISGQVFFLQEIPMELKLNESGEIIPKTITFGKVFVINYLGQVYNLKIFPNTILLITHQMYLHPDDPVMELPSKKLSETKTIRYICASHSGEIFFENNSVHHLNKLRNPNKLIWILFGQPYQIPLQSELKIKPFLQIFDSIPLASLKLINLTSGQIISSKSIRNNYITSFQIFQYLRNLNSFKIYLQTTKNLNKFLTIYNVKNNLIKLQLNQAEILLKNFISIGYLENFIYQLKTGGILCFLNYRMKKNSLPLIENHLKKGCTVFYIPENDYRIYKDKKYLKVQTGDSVDALQEIFHNIFNLFPGTIEVFQSKNLIENIKVKPGHQIRLNTKNNYKKYHQQIYYPGEYIFDQYKIKSLSYGEIIQTSTKIFLLLRPLVRYEIVNIKSDFAPFLFPNNFNFELKIEDVEFPVLVNKFIKILKPINLSQQTLIIQSKIPFSNAITNLKLEMTPKNFAQLNIITNETVFVEEAIPKEIEKMRGFLIPFVENNQFVESYTILATINVLNSQNLKPIYSLKSIKELKIKNTRKILLINDLDYHFIYFEDKAKFNNINFFVKKGESIGNNLISSKSGFISNYFGSKMALRLAQGYLFSEGAKIKKEYGFVEENEQLGQILYERTKTDDIVQGLPKIEELLEARRPKKELIIMNHPGIIRKFKISHIDVDIWFSYNNVMLGVNQISEQTINLYNFSSKKLSKVLQSFQFISVAQSLIQDLSIPINPHLILTAYFYYYKSFEFFSTYTAAYRSFKKIQGLILESVQNIYHSQGVYIANKHLELIIRKMTMRGKILESGDTGLLMDEILVLTKINYINYCLKPSNQSVQYEPILLGITRAALKTESFLSAASFQETVKVLTHAAIHGKTDWLHGLKENIITGRLIPAGTGFKFSEDVSHRFITIPNKKEKKEKLLEIKDNQITKKYLKLSNKKFI